MSGPTLLQAVAAVTAAWEAQVITGDLSRQTVDRLVPELARLVGCARRRGVRRLAHLDEETARFYVEAPTWRDGVRVAPSPATQHLHRWVVRLFARNCRLLGMACPDPTRDIVLPRGPARPGRALTAAEVEACQRAADRELGHTRSPAAFALSLAGATSAEVGRAVVGDLELSRGRVHLRGSRATTPRWADLSPWSAHALQRRVHDLLAGRPVASGTELGLVCGGTAGPASQQASACMALAAVLRAAGLAASDVGPASVRAYVATAVYADTGRLEAVAARLGLRTVDAAARLVEPDWRTGWLLDVPAGVGGTE